MCWYFLSYSCASDLEPVIDEPLAVLARNELKGLTGNAGVCYNNCDGDDKNIPLEPCGCSLAGSTAWPQWGDKPMAVPSTVVGRSYYTVPLAT
jgi:hypothetical protein